MAGYRFSGRGLAAPHACHRGWSYGTPRSLFGTIDPLETSKHCNQIYTMANGYVIIMVMYQLKTLTISQIQHLRRPLRGGSDERCRLVLRSQGRDTDVSPHSLHSPHDHILILLQHLEEFSYPLLRRLLHHVGHHLPRPATPAHLASPIRPQTGLCLFIMIRCPKQKGA
jgi:hypothetical protein